MSALRAEIIRKIDRMNPEQQQGVLDFITRTLDEAEKASGDWLEEILTLEKQVTAKYGETHFPSIAETINEIREERLDDLMGRE
jgi:hypothetical protein